MPRDTTVSDTLAAYARCHREALEWAVRLRTVPAGSAEHRAMWRKATHARLQAERAYRVFVSAIEVRCYDDSTDPYDPEHRKTAEAACAALDRIVKEGAR